MQTDYDLSDWLSLCRVPGLGPTTYNALVQHFGCPRQVFEATPQQLAKCGLQNSILKGLTSCPDQSLIAADLKWLEHEENHILTLHHPDYPPLLKELPDPPPVLYVTGDTQLLSRHQLAIVGSRNPSPSGRENAYEFSRSLSQCSYLITSGLALGVDSASHHGALDADTPTLAVTGTGLDRVYPASNRQLAHKIAENGAILSEFPIGTPPRRENFPRRNRLISGLSLGTLVVEAAVNSGSLITARLALEQGREVFAIPGSIHSPLSHGCHALIREGAKLVECIDDIIEELGAFGTPGQTPPNSRNKATCNANIDPKQQKVLDNIDYAPTTIDMLVTRTGLTADQLSSILLMLELQNQIVSLSGGTFTRLNIEEIR